MSTKASGKLMNAHKQGNSGVRTKPGLREFLDENVQYADALQKINQKLALKDAIDRAHVAIESSRKGTSQMGGDDQFDAQSKASTHSKYSMVTVSQRDSKYGGQSQSSRRTHSQVTGHKSYKSGGSKE